MNFDISRNDVVRGGLLELNTIMIVGLLVVLSNTDISSLYSEKSDLTDAIHLANISGFLAHMLVPFILSAIMTLKNSIEWAKILLVLGFSSILFVISLLVMFSQIDLHYAESGDPSRYFREYSQGEYADGALIATLIISIVIYFAMRNYVKKKSLKNN
ncbi:hypothetical protein K0U27_00710 [archaeon]|nr:hypothetical protein [archaeon]